MPSQACLTLATASALFQQMMPVSSSVRFLGLPDNRL